MSLKPLTACLAALCLWPFTLQASECGTEPPPPVHVATAEALGEALTAPCPGTEILIAPGHYRGKFRMTEAAAGTSERPIVVAAEEGLGSVVIDGDGAAVTWKLDGAANVVLRGLEITGGGYHGVFFDHGARDITVTGNRIHDNTGKPPLDSHAEIKGSNAGPRVARITLRGNEIYHSAHPDGGNFQGIDCNGCDDWRIEGNYIHDIGRPTSQPHSYFDRGSCIQMKSLSRGTVIDGNLIRQCHIGIVLGGEGLESPENLGGTVTNNIVLDSEEIGIAVVNARDARIAYNTVLGPARGIVFAEDGRFADSANTGEAANNLFAAAVKDVPADIAWRGNVVIPGLSADALFKAWQDGDFRIRPGVPPLSEDTVWLSPEIAHDYRGMPRRRGETPDAGAVARDPAK